jgi:uncharacterized membrane protein
MTAAGAVRRPYLDLVRGWAVLIMIEAHVIDSWTRASDRSSDWFGWSLIVGGFGAPLFLFLAGIAVSLSAGSKVRRSGDVRSASRAVQKRGLEIFVLALLFRVQAVVISRSTLRSLLRVDILNIMGPAVVATAWLWARFSNQRARLIGLASVTIAIAFATPIVRAAAWVGSLPDFVEAYIRPVPQLTNFAIFPWAAFVPAGAVVGALIDEARVPAVERRLNLALGAGGVALAIAAYSASFLPSPYARSNFWTSSPAFFFLRLGLMVAAVAAAFAWAQRAGASERWSPVQLLGRSSLFIYWIHVEMVYGIVSLPLHGALSLSAAWIALVAFWAFMLLLAIVKGRAQRWWKAGGFGGAGGSRAPLLTPP